MFKATNISSTVKKTIVRGRYNGQNLKSKKYSKKLKSRDFWAKNTEFLKFWQARGDQSVQAERHSGFIEPATPQIKWGSDLLTKQEVEVLSLSMIKRTMNKTTQSHDQKEANT